MEYLIIGTSLLILNLLASVIVVNEDILYTKKDRFYKILFILLVPFIGAIVELYKSYQNRTFSNKYYKEKYNCSENNDVKWYAFWSKSDSSHSGGAEGGSGGGD